MDVDNGGPGGDGPRPDEDASADIVPPPPSPAPPPPPAMNTDVTPDPDAIEVTTLGPTPMPRSAKQGPAWGWVAAAITVLVVGIVGAVLYLRAVSDKNEAEDALAASLLELDEAEASLAAAEASLVEATQVIAALISAEDPDPVSDVGFVYGSGECPAADGSDGPQLDFAEPQPLCIDPSSDYTAVLDTSEGEIRIALDTDSVPGTVNNFATLARWGYYDNTLLFRTDPSIAIIQGGSPHTNTPSDPGPGYTISDEPSFTVSADGNPTGPYRYVPGQLVMARSFGVNSASAQFFFTTGPEAALLDGQGTYVVFGTTDDAGLAILQSIIALHVPGETLGGAPSREVTINSVTIEAA